MKQDIKDGYAIVQTMVGGAATLASTLILATTKTPWVLLPVGCLIFMIFGIVHLMDTTKER